jgi:hypothetical protein
MAKCVGLAMLLIWLSRLAEFCRYAPVAQLDRVPGYEPGGREFESLRARQRIHRLKPGFPKTTRFTIRVFVVSL